MATSRRTFLAAAGALGAGLASQIGLGEESVAPPDKQPVGVAIPTAASRKIGWAVVGLGQLAIEEVLPAFAQCKTSQLTALVSGHPAKAKQLAKVYGVPSQNIYNYENYDSLRENPDVDVIYIILPNSMHAEYTIRGLAAGKHVLCEKPMATNVAECERMIAQARESQRKLMVAYRLRYEPFNEKVISLAKNMECGRIKLITASNCQNVKAPNIRLVKSLGGGPLEDVGIYCLNAARYITGQEPVEVSAAAFQPKDDPRFQEVPESVVFRLQFADGIQAQCSCSFGTEISRRFRVDCTDGFIDLEDAFAYRGQSLRVKQKKEEVRFQIDPVNHFSAEMDHLSGCVLAETAPRTPGEDGLADIRVMQAIGQAIRDGKSVRVTPG